MFLEELKDVLMVNGQITDDFYNKYKNALQLRSKNDIKYKYKAFCENILKNADKSFKEMWDKEKKAIL